MTDRAPQAERAERLRALHHSKQLLELVNVWDVASALEVASWPETTALATASAAIAASHGYEDGENIPRDLHLATIGRICAATSLPVTADLERGYDDVAATVRAGLDCGVVGANLEDDLCPVDLMTERVRAAVATGAAAGVPLVVNARTDVYLHGTALDAGERLRSPGERTGVSRSRGRLRVRARVRRRGRYRGAGRDLRAWPAESPGRPGGSGRS